MTFNERTAATHGPDWQVPGGDRRGWRLGHRGGGGAGAQRHPGGAIDRLHRFSPSAWRTPRARQCARCAKGRRSPICSQIARSRKPFMSVSAKAAMATTLSAVAGVLRTGAPSTPCCGAGPTPRTATLRRSRENAGARFGPPPRQRAAIGVKRRFQHARLRTGEAGIGKKGAPGYGDEWHHVSSLPLTQSNDAVHAAPTTASGYWGDPPHDGQRPEIGGATRSAPRFASRTCKARTSHGVGLTDVSRRCSR
jgi:hypothetical protein